LKERGIKGVRLINKINKSKIYLWKSKGVVADET